MCLFIAIGCVLLLLLGPRYTFCNSNLLLFYIFYNINFTIYGEIGV